MRVAVVGGSGFVGRHLVRQLLEGGHAAVNVDLHPPPALLPGEATVVVDLLGPGEVEATARALGHVDGLVWLAARIRQRTGVDETAVDDLRLMVDAPLRMLRSLYPAPTSVVNMSSVQVYGRPTALPVGEDHPTEPFTAYGVAKLNAEDVLRIAGEQRGSRVASLRAAFIYGPGQHPDNVLPRFLRAVRRGEAPVVHGPGSDVRDDVYVADVARAVDLALMRRAHGVFNIASGRPHTLAEVARTVCALGPPGLVPRHDDATSAWVDRWFLADRARAAFGFEAQTAFADGVRATWEADDGR